MIGFRFTKGALPSKSILKRGLDALIVSYNRLREKITLQKIELNAPDIYLQKYPELS